MKRCGLETFAIYFHPRTPLHVVSRRRGTVLAVHSVPGTRPRAGTLPELDENAAHQGAEEG